MYQRILVPLDTSELGKNALATAIDMATTSKAKLTVLRIHSEPARLDVVGSREDLDAIETETQELVDAAIATAGESVIPDHILATVRSGPIVKTILDTAEELRSEVIVLGSHGREGLAEAFTGSTSERIVKNATCDVLVVKPKGFPYLRD